MTLSLVPPEIEKPLDAMTEEQAKQHLQSISSPLLNEMRAKIPRMTTSEMLSWFVHPEVVAAQLHADASSDESLHMLTMAAIFSLGCEIDRRIPRPASSDE